MAGFRAGWMVVSGRASTHEDIIEGLDVLANMRLCANVPAQHAIQAALGGPQSINDLVLPGGRLHEQRDRAWKLLTDIPGVTCTMPKGACTSSRGWTPRSIPSTTTSSWCSICCCRSTCSSSRAGFNWPRPDHVRIVTLPHVDDLEAALGRFGTFLERYRQ